jgi:thiol-disulfide isomerase/thioredoxin
MFRETPESILLAVESRARALKRVEYDVKRVYNYPAEQYLVETGRRVHHDYTPTETRAPLRFVIDGVDYLSVFNGTDLFDGNQKTKTSQLIKSVSEGRLETSSGLQHSLFLLRDGLGALVRSKSTQLQILPNPNPNCLVIDAKLTKCALDGFGRVNPVAYDQQLEFTFDRKSLLPIKIIQRFPKDGTITNDYSKVKLDPPARKPSDYFYTSYLNTFPLEVPKNLKPLEIGALAPDFALEKADGSGKIALQALRGKRVLLDFFIVYCGYCVESVPKLNRWQKEFPDVVFLAINIEDSRDVVKSFIQRNQLQLPTVLGPQKLADAYGVPGFPALILLGADGRVQSESREGSASIEKKLRTPTT